MTTTEAEPEHVVWAIGDDDYDPRAFSATLLTEASSTVPTFTVGESDIGSAWPRIHPGPLDESTGFRSQTMSIDFVLTEEDAAEDLSIALDFFASHGPCPQLDLSLNGVTGRVIPDVIRARRSDSYMRLTPTAGRCHRLVQLPPGLAQVGANTLTVTTTANDPLADEEKLPARLPFGTWFGSAITWRRLALVRSAGEADVQLQVRPTPFFLRADDDATSLRSVVDVVVTSAAALVAGAVLLELQGKTFTHDFAGHAFGDTRVRFAVPEWSGTIPADVTLTTEDGQVITTSADVSAARQWTVHLLPHVHVDLGYTDGQAKTIELHSRNIDIGSRIIEAEPDYRYTIDGGYSLSQYLRTRPPARRERLYDDLRGGHLDVNAFSMQFLSGLASLEEIYRAADLGLELRDVHGAPIRHAHLTDVPSYSGSLPGVLRSLGIDAFMGIANHLRGGNADSDQLQLISPFRWQGLDGTDVLSFFADCYTQLRFVCADPPTLPGLEDGLQRLLRLYERPDYLPSDLPLVGTHSDNEDLADGYADLIDKWSQHFAYPRLRFSTISEYFDSVRDLRDSLPLVVGDGGSYWEDDAGTHLAAIAEYRTAQALLPAAESLLALTSVVDGSVVPDRVALDSAWENLLIGCEHTWTSWQATYRPEAEDVADQLDWKLSHIHAAWRTARDEASRGLSQLAEFTGLRAPAILVMNTRSRRRSLTFDLDLEKNARLLDVSGRDVQFDVLGAVGTDLVRARVRVPDVEAFGYTSLRVDTGDGPREAEHSMDTALSTARYILQIDEATGRITSLVHRPSGRELLDVAHEHSLGDVLYVTGGGDADSRGYDHPTERVELTSLFCYDPSLPRPKLSTTRAEMRYVGSVRTPNGIRARFQGRAPTMPAITVDVEIGEETDTVEIDLQLQKEHELAKESVYVAFPFAMAGATMRYDRQNGWVDPHHDHLPGACNDWLAVQSGAALEAQDGPAIVLATPKTPLLTLEPVQGKWAVEPVPVTGALYSWIMNNYWFTNTPPSQGGSIALRYAFVPMAHWDEAAATNFVRDFRAPALFDRVTPQDRTQDRADAPLPRDGRLLEIVAPDNVDLRVFTRRTGTGIVLRVQETAGRLAEVAVRHPVGVPGQTWLTTVYGKRISPLSPDQGWIAVQVQPREDVTVEIATE